MRAKLNIKYILLTALLGIFFTLMNCKIFNTSNTSTDEKFYKKFKQLKKEIYSDCDILSISPRMFISTIYGELHNNYNLIDNFDNFRARIGMDPSVGFAQIRVSTSLWIEDNYADNRLIYKSRNNTELVNKIIIDSINVLYAVFYIKLIHDKLLNKFHKEPTVKLVASYYGKGIDYYRENNVDSSYYNQIGITAQEFYDSDKLLDYFPK